MPETLLPQSANQKSLARKLLKFDLPPAAKARIEEIRTIMVAPPSEEEKKVNHRGALDSFVSELVRLRELACRVISGDTICQKLSDEDRDFLESVLQSAGLRKGQVRAALRGTGGEDSQDRPARRTKRTLVMVRKGHR